MDVNYRLIVMIIVAGLFGYGFMTVWANLVPEGNVLALAAGLIPCFAGGFLIGRIFGPWINS